MLIYIEIHSEIFWICGILEIGKPAEFLEQSEIFFSPLSDVLAFHQ